MNRAMDLLAKARAKVRPLGAHPADGQPVEVRKGRFGPYAQHGNRVANLPRNVEMEAGHARPGGAAPGRKGQGAGAEGREGATGQGGRESGQGRRRGGRGHRACPSRRPEGVGRQGAGAQAKAAKPARERLGQDQAGRASCETEQRRERPLRAEAGRGQSQARRRAARAKARGGASAAARRRCRTGASPIQGRAAALSRRGAGARRQDGDRAALRPFHRSAPGAARAASVIEGGRLGGACRTARLRGAGSPAGDGGGRGLRRRSGWRPACPSGFLAGGERAPSPRPDAAGAPGPAGSGARRAGARPPQTHRCRSLRGPNLQADRLRRAGAHPRRLRERPHPADRSAAARGLDGAGRRAQRRRARRDRAGRTAAGPCARTASCADHRAAGPGG